MWRRFRSNCNGQHKKKNWIISAFFVIESKEDQSFTTLSHIVIQKTPQGIAEELKNIKSSSIQSNFLSKKPYAETGKNHSLRVSVKSHG